MPLSTQQHKSFYSARAIHISLEESHKARLMTVVMLP